MRPNTRPQAARGTRSRSPRLSSMRAVSIESSCESSMARHRHVPRYGLNHQLTGNAPTEPAPGTQSAPPGRWSCGEVLAIRQPTAAPSPRAQGLEIETRPPDFGDVCPTSSILASLASIIFAGSPPLTVHYPATTVPATTKVTPVRGCCRAHSSPQHHVFAEEMSPIVVRLYPESTEARRPCR